MKTIVILLAILMSQTVLAGEKETSELEKRFFALERTLQRDGIIGTFYGFELPNEGVKPMYVSGQKLLSDRVDTLELILKAIVKHFDIKVEYQKEKTIPEHYKVTEK